VPAYSDRRPAPRWLLVVAGAAIVVTAVAIPWLDEPVARALEGTDVVPGVWAHGLDILEWAVLLPVFSWAGAIVMVIGMIAAAGVRAWRDQAPAWMLLASTHIVARVITGWLKDDTGRLRPREWHGGATFWHATGASFPSGHIALFASVAIPLAVVSPRIGRPIALVVVPFVMIARVLGHAHFISDVTAGVALVCLVTYLMGAVIRPCAR
jgi:membrane-associated phospholipid phosphatase